jgi:hypothetical protein
MSISGAHHIIRPSGFDKRARERNRLPGVDPVRRSVMKTNTIVSSLRTLARTPMLLALLAPSAASAQSKATEASGDDWVPVKHLEFTDDEIEGGVYGPAGELITSVPRAEHSSLIEIREGFEAEIIKTLENL